MKIKNKTIINSLFILIIPTAVLMSLCVGRYPIAVQQVWQSLFNLAGIGQYNIPAQVYHIVCFVRLPRTIIGLIVGACLSASGCAFQGVFKNPLVSQGVLGVSSGAGFGAALSIVLFSTGKYTSYFAFVFGILAVSLSYLIANTYLKSSTIMLVLGGMVISSLFSSMLSFLKFAADPTNQLSSIVMWNMGSLASVSLKDILFPAVSMILGIVILLFSGRAVNVLSMGDEEAKSLGMPVKFIKAFVICGATLATAGAVSICGTVGWVGLVVPHITRFLTGSDNRKLIPGSMVLGGGFLVLVDIMCRTITPAEIPIGIMLSFIGGPFFIYLIRKYKGGDWK